MNFAYHRLARSWPGYAWWRPLVAALIGFAIYLFLSAVVAIAFVVPAIVAPGTFGDPQRLIERLTALDLSDPAIFAFAMGSIALLLPAVILARLSMGPRPLGLLSSVAGRLRWGWLVRCIGPALAVYAAVFSVSFLVLDPLTGAPAPAPVVTASTFGLVALALLLTPLQATAEEYVFRGFLMQAIGGWLRHPAWAILLPVPLFAIGHRYDVWGLLDVSIFGVAAAWLTWRTGGLEAAIVAHVINNTLLFLLGAFALVDTNARTGSPVALATTVTIMLAYSAIIVRQANRCGLQRSRFVPLSAEPLPAPIPAAPSA